MPKVVINILEGKTKNEKDILLDTIHKVLIDTIHIPEYDRLHILHEHSRSSFCMPNTGDGDYINIDIIMYSGRSLQKKENLFRTMKARLGELGLTAGNIMITLHEPEIHNWSS